MSGCPSIPSGFGFHRGCRWHHHCCPEVAGCHHIGGCGCRRSTRSAALLWRCCQGDQCWFADQRFRRWGTPDRRLLCWITARPGWLCCSGECPVGRRCGRGCKRFGQSRRWLAVGSASRGCALRQRFGWGPVASSVRRSRPSRRRCCAGLAERGLWSVGSAPEPWRHHHGRLWRSPPPQRWLCDRPLNSCRSAGGS